MKFCVLALLCVVSANACQFTATYLFDDGMAVSAGFQGHIKGNLITDLSQVSMHVTGTWWPDGYHCPTLIQSYTDGGLGIKDGGAVMSLDGSIMNFRLSTQHEVEEGEDWWDWNGLWMAYAQTGSTLLYHYVAGGNYNYDRSRWSVRAVPDRGATALLLGTAIIGLLAIHASRLAAYRSRVG